MPQPDAKARPASRAKRVRNVQTRRKGREVDLDVDTARSYQAGQESHCGAVLHGVKVLRSGQSHHTDSGQETKDLKHRGAP